MPVVAAAASAIFSATVSFATAVGTAALTSMGLGGMATMGIASFTGSLTVATAVGAVMVGSTAINMFTMARKLKAGQGSASPIAFKADPNAPLNFVAGGPVGIGGNQVFAQTAGRKNAYLTYVVSLGGGGPYHSVTPFKAADVAVNFDAGHGAIGTYNRRMWQKFALGAVAGATALTMSNVFGKDAPGTDGGHPPEWTAAHTLPSIAHAMWCLKYDTDRYPQLPKPIWEVRGGPVYDPRKDSTFPGGNGPQRANDRATWSTEGNQNPALQALTYSIGHTFNGVRLGGVGIPVQAIDVPAFVYAANVCDANGWKIAWEWNTSMRKWDVLATMLQAGGCVPIVRGSKLSCMVEAPRVSLDTITDADLKGPFSVTGSAQKNDRKNTIIPRCKSGPHKWTVQPFGPVTSASWVAEDGGERVEEIEYEGIADFGDQGRQVRQIAAYDLANMREGLAATLPVPMRFIKYRAGDCLTVNAPSTLMNGQKVIIMKREVDLAARIVKLTVRSETDGKHAFALTLSGEGPPTPSLTGVDPLVVEPPTPGAWVAEPGTGGGSGSAPIIVVRPTVPPSEPGNGGAYEDDPSAQSILLRWRPVDGVGTPLGSGVWAEGEYPAKSNRIELPGLMPRTRYAVEIAYRVRGIAGDWTFLGYHQTGDLIANDSLLVGGQPVSEIIDRLLSAEALATNAAAAVAALEEQFEELGDLAQIVADTAAAAAEAVDAAAAAVIAQGSAQAAAADAQDQASAAALAALTADGAATAAAGSASTATTKAGDAEASAAAANASQTSAGIARDQALAALAQQGRLNLVQKGRVTGTPVAFAEGASGWGFTIQTSSGSRVVQVGPLKTGTPYSLSFKARRVAGDTTTLSVDLFPDTLPERVFVVTSDQWTEYKWEGITSNHADMTLPTVHLRFFRAGIPAGNVFDVTDIKLEEGATASAWTPHPRDIEMAASAAATSASNAAASQTAAGVSASAAQTAKTDAETARGQAQTFATNASNAADTATASAATATTQAGLATTARNQASGFADAALTSRNQASSYADAAGISAAASQSSAVTASTASTAAVGAAIAGMSDTISSELWTAQGSGAPESRANLSPALLNAGQFAPGNTTTAGPKFYVPWVQGRIYEVTYTVSAPAGAPAAYARQRWDRMAAGFTQINGGATAPALLAAGTEETRVQRWGCGTSAGGSGNIGSGAAWLWFSVQVNLNAAGNGAVSGAGHIVRAFMVRDVTAQVSADTSASAAATSASNASASETAAGQSASAAQTAKTDAETARGQAQTFASNASTSASNAAGSANTATTQAGLATTARNQADGFAQSAAGSAATATTKANEAGLSAAAASASQVSAALARDQAMAALVQQGRTNLVQKSRVNGDVVVFSESVSGWGYRLEGGIATARISYVGPLKQDTEYSVSFKARRVAGSTTTMNVDLFPDTLPERVFAVTSDQWTEYKWEGITSSHADMLSASVQLRFFRAGLPAAHVFEVTDIKLEEGPFATAWTPSPKDIEYSASAAATSASNAAASQTAAGVSASAAQGFATNAQTQAGNALTYANQASSSASNAQAASISSGTSAATALGAAIMTFPEEIRADLWTVWNSTGPAASRPNLNAAWVQDGAFVDFNTAGPKQRIRWETGRVIELSSVVHNPHSQATQWVHIGSRFNESLGYIDFNSAGPVQTIPAGQTVTVTTRMAMGAAIPGTTNFAQNGAAWVGVAVRNNLQSGRPLQVRSMTVRDVTSEVAAASSASTATTQAANASASAAAASISADLAAGVSINPNLLPNGGGENGTTGWAGLAGLTAQDWPPYGGRILKQPLSGNYTNAYISSDYGYATAGNPFTMSWRGWVENYTATANAYMVFYNSSLAYVGESPRVRLDAANRKITHTAPAGTAYVRMAIHVNGNANSAGAALVWNYVKIEAGTEATAYNTARDNVDLRSSLNITAATTADLATRMATARFEVTAAAGGNLAQLKIRADTSGSLAGLVAGAISFSNTISGTVVKVMEITGGNVFITGVLILGTPGGGRIEINGPQMRIDVFDANNVLRVRMGKLS